MAVNLKAVATLNNKPFIKSLNEISAATKRLNSTGIVGSTKGNNQLKDQISSIERASGAATLAANSAASNARKAATGFSTINRSAAEYVNGLKNISAASDQAIKRMGTMTQKQIALENSSRALRNARRNLADVMSVERVDGDPVAERAARQLRAAETAQARNIRARRAEVHAAIDQTAAERALTNARDKGESSARKYRNAVAGLNGEQLRARQLANNLAIAEGNLARQMAASSGLRSPAVLAAENRLMRAQGAIQAENAIGMNAATNSMTAQRRVMSDLSRQFAMGALGMSIFPALAIGFSAAWESSFSNVVRTADPAFSQVESKVQGLRASLVNLTQSMPIGFGRVTEIATLANQMGIATGEVASFTQAVAMFSATSGVSVDISATAFGRLTSILGDNRLGFMEMADSILKVGVNSVATEEEIINVTTQISSIAAQAGFAGKDIIGLSGALASVRVPPELSRGLVTRVFGTIDKAVAGGSSSLATLARVSGMTSEQFKEGWGGKGAAGVFNQFLQGLQKGGAAARGELEALGITSVRDVPVLLRLANAADSEGNVGGLLTQTLNDANNAAGETQRQYSIMAETVVSKLKMLGNNIAAFFDGVGQTGLGVFGNIIDGISTGLRNLTRDLEKPMKLFGAFELPWTNAEGLGLVVTLSAITAGLLLLGSAAMKVGAAVMAGLQFKAAIPTLMALAGAAKATSGGLIVAAGSTTKFSGAMSGAVGGAGRFAGGLRGISSMLGGPWGIAIIAAIGVVAALGSAMKNARTDADQFSETLASIDLTSIENVNVALAQIQTGGAFFDKYLGTDLGTPFKKGIASLREYTDLASTISTNHENIFGGTVGLTKAFGELAKTAATKLFPGMASTNEGIEILDESFGKLANSGNSGKAMDMIMSLSKQGVNLQEVFNTGKASEMEGFLKRAFDLQGIEMTDSTLRQLGEGTLPQVSDSMYGFAGATKVVMDLFEGDADAVGAFTEALAAATASFIDFGAAAEAAFDEGNFDLSKYMETLQQQMTDQANWSANMETVSDYVSAPLMEKLASDTSEAGIAAMAALAQGLRDGSPEAIAAVEQLESNLAAAVREGSGTEIRMAFRQWASAIMGDEGLGRSLTQALDETQFTQLQDAAQKVGRDTAAGILKGIESGELTFEQGLRELRIALDLKPTVKMDESEIEKSMKALNASLKKRDGGEFNIPVTIDSSTTVGDLRSIIDDPSLNSLDINADLTLTEAYAQSREFQVWAEEQGIEFLLGANTESANYSLAALVAIANGTVAQISLNALPVLAEGAIWELVQTANGTKAFVQIDAESGEAVQEVAHVVDEATGSVATIPLSADDKEAIAALQLVSDKARTTPAEVTITALDNASGTIDWIARDRRAFVSVEVAEVPYRPKAIWESAHGNIFEAYAKGGVREDHRPQIAPAGAMRLWAEPETGGEAYIPFAMDRRKRAEGILNTVADRFGYSLVRGNNVSQYANGGMYELQSRTRYDRMRNDRTRSADIQRDLNFTFVNPVEKDWAKDAWEKAQMVGALV